MPPNKTITLAHGSGGSTMSNLIKDSILKYFVGVGSKDFSLLEDQARLDLPISQMEKGDRLAFTTDSYVITPIKFPGGDIGKLAVNGTVNDLSVGGARPLYLSCALIIEEGLEISELEDIMNSMSEAAKEAGVQIVTGDTKVVPSGAADKLFINTAGIGIIPKQFNLSVSNAKVGDKIIINNSVGRHGAVIADIRGDMGLIQELTSDTCPLNDITKCILKSAPNCRTMRDATRGGLVSVLNEISEASNVGLHIDENLIPIEPQVLGVCEILGLDPLYLANEGLLVAIVPEERAEETVKAIRKLKHGKQACIIGDVVDKHKQVVMQSSFGGNRILNTLSSEPLPRIC